MTKDKAPLVSIVIPAYNAEKYLKECIESVEKQTYKNIEAIVVDDGSSDGTLEIAKSFAKKYKNVTVISKKNGGMGPARNTGLEHAKGEYLYPLDSDDTITEHCIERLVSIAEKEKVDVVSTLLDQSLTKEKLGNKVQIMTGVEALCEDMNMHIPTASCGRLYSRKIFEKEKYPDLRYGEDFNFNIRFWPIAEKVAIVDDYTYMYRITPGSVMNSPYDEKKADIIPTIDLLEQMSNDKKYAKKVRNTMKSGCYLQALATLLKIYETDTKKYAKDYKTLLGVAKRNCFYTFSNREVDVQHRKFALCSILSVKLTLKMIVKAYRKSHSE